MEFADKCISDLLPYPLYVTYCVPLMEKMSTSMRLEKYPLLDFW
jgi:hypothetical protein